MALFFDVLNVNSTWWNILGFKLASIFITVVLAVWVGNWLYDKKGKNK